MFQLANAIMKMSAGFMGSQEFWRKWFNDKDLPKDKTDVLDAQYGWVETIYNGIMTILVPLLAIVAAAGIIWAIVLGVNMARADSTEKREEAKKRLIGLVIGIVILVVLIVFFTTLFPVILGSLIKFDPSTITTATTATSST
ncbi:MAG: pilin [Firmicutes bacterium]|nr:pilin [Bacillota bacterium]MDY3658818.1 hypothetical protein [Eubacteriales bacterium]